MLSKKHDSKQLMSNWGFKMAAQFSASLGGLRNSMDKIMTTYLLGIKDEKKPQHHDIETEINDLNEKATEKENEIKLEKEKHNQIKEEVEHINIEIEAIRIDSEGDFLNSEFNWAKVILTTVFTVFLGVALVFFYSSLINNAIFADFGQRINNMNMDDLSIFNSIIDTNLLFSLSIGTFISYLFSTLFIAIGILLHFDVNNNKKRSFLIKAAFISIAFFAEVLFAYNIENNIYELKMMTGLVDEMPGFWEMIISKEVFTVLVLGFVSYLVWSLLFEVNLKEWRKRNPKKMAAIQIKELNRVINRRRHDIRELKKDIQLLENDITILEQRIKALKLRLEHVFFDENEIENRLNDFFTGWLKYINLHSAHASSRNDYENEFEQYKTELITKHSLVEGN